LKKRNNEKDNVSIVEGFPETETLANFRKCPNKPKNLEWDEGMTKVQTYDESRVGMLGKNWVGKLAESAVPPRSE